jgi:hypothetical protein
MYHHQVWDAQTGKNSTHLKVMKLGCIPYALTTRNLHMAL